MITTKKIMKNHHFMAKRRKNEVSISKSLPTNPISAFKM